MSENKQRRMIFHWAPGRISVGVNIDEENKVTAAIAACHPRDEFTRAMANTILNGRLNFISGLDDKGNFTYSNSLLYLGEYSGLTPGKDVYGPVRDFCRRLTKRRDIEYVKIAIEAKQFSLTTVFA